MSLDQILPPTEDNLCLHRERQRYCNKFEGRCKYRSTYLIPYTTSDGSEAGRKFECKRMAQKRDFMPKGKSSQGDK